MSEKRRAILDRVRSTKLPDCELPDLAQAWVQYENPWQQFADMLAAVGGTFVEVGSPGTLSAWLQEHELLRQAQRVCSLVPEVPGNVQLAGTNPRDLADLDLVIATGEIAVAENGAVWVSDRNVPQRAALFIAQHAVLVLARSSIVHNLHEAYERLSFGHTGFGVFISGPSKTADIEQSLVIGAHGPKTLHAVIVG